MAPSTHLQISRLALATILTAIALPAQGAPPKQMDSSEARARAKFRSAQRAYDLGQFSEALRTFSEAYELKPLPAFLFNIAQCHRHLGNYDRAGFFYQRYLALASLGAHDAEVVRDLIREVERRQSEREEAGRREAQEAVEREKEAARLAAARAEAEAAEKRRAELEAKAQSDEASRRRVELALRLKQSEKAEANDWTKQLHRKWWFWTGVGLLAAGTGVTVYLVTAPHPPATNLTPIDGR